MSKVFEALKKHGNASEADLSSILEDEKAQEAALATSPEIAVEEFAAAAAPAQEPAPPTVETAPEEPALFEPWAVRVLPLRLSNSAPILPFEESDGAAGEQYRIVRTKILQHARQPRMILISSPGPRDGKSISAVNLAGALSLKSESNVLLVDADFRRPVIHEHLGIPEGPGLADLIRGKTSLQAAVIQVEQLPNLYVLTAGKERSNPAEMLDSSRWLTVCAQIRESFEFIVVDAPPVAAVADYDLLQAVSDGVVVVVRPDHTKRGAWLGALRSIPQDKFLGVLLNCVHDWFLGKIYS